MLSSIFTQILIGVGVVVVAAIGKVLNNWLTVEKEKVNMQKQKTVKKEAYEALEIGVNAVQQQVIEGMKAAAEDGKISKDEYQLLRNKAIAKAVEVASGPAVEIITGMAVSAIQSIIDSILQKKKQ